MKRLVDGLENKDYHGDKAISKTTLDLVARDVYAPLWARECPTDKDKLKTFDFGDAMHAICLEPERLKEDFVIMPEFNGRTSQGKADKADWIKENESKKILTTADHKKLNLMFESVMAHFPCRNLIEADGFAERSYFWTDEETGLECKCRPDKYIPSRRLLVDVKTTEDLSKFHFSVDDYRYYVQDPWYCDGVAKFDGPVEMEFLVIQKKIECGRYPVMVVNLPPEAIEYGRVQYRRDIRKYADFMTAESEYSTPELAMSHRFLENAMEAITEVQI